MQRRKMYAPSMAKNQRRSARLTRRTRFKFDALTHPISPDSFSILIKGYCEQPQGGRISGILDVGGRIMRAGQVHFSATMGEARLAIPDQAYRYDSITMTLWPEPNKTFVLPLGVLEAPDPRYVYRVMHKFTTEDDEARNSEMDLAKIENAIFEAESDADQNYDDIVARVSSGGTGTTDLDGVTTFDDGTTIARNVQKQKIAVPPDWVPKDGLN